jgi:hypothetical protein
MHLPPPANAPLQPCCATLDTKRDYSATDLAMVASINLHNHENPTSFVSNGQPVGPQEGFSCRLVPHETSQRIRNRNDRSKPCFGSENTLIFFTSDNGPETLSLQNRSSLPRQPRIAAWYETLGLWQWYSGTGNRLLAHGHQARTDDR